jgi:5'-nucleotidase
VPEIDLVLGGHDHDYYQSRPGRTWVVKSGTDFRELSRITLTRPLPAGPAPWAERPPVPCTIEHVLVTRAVAPDPEAARLVTFHTARLAVRMAKVLCGLAQPLDARFSQIRTVETNASNWVR